MPCIVAADINQVSPPNWARPGTSPVNDKFDWHLVGTRHLAMMDQRKKSPLS